MPSRLNNYEKLIISIYNLININDSSYTAFYVYTTLYMYLGLKMKIVCNFISIDHIYIIHNTTYILCFIKQIVSNRMLYSHNF